MYRILNPVLTNQLNEVKNLFIEYQHELGHDLCFQDFQTELNTLPGKYKGPEGHILLIRDVNNPEIAGCVALRKFKEHICEMKRLYIRPQFRNKGYAKILVIEILRLAKEKGYHEMILDTLEELKGALILYKKFGFEEIKPYYMNPLKGVIFMSKKLK